MRRPGKKSGLREGTIAVWPAAMTSQALTGPLTTAFLGARLSAGARGAQWNAAGAREGAGGRQSARRSAPALTVAMAGDGNGKDGRKGVRVQIRVEHQVDYGEHVALLGSAKWLGRWKKPVPMRWSEQGWIAEVEAQAGEQAEFKFVVCRDNDVQQWEGGPNRTFSVPANEALLRATTAWDATEEGLRLEPLKDGNEPWPVSGRKDGNGNGRGVPQPRESFAPIGGSEFAKGWQGKEVNFMRSNEHSRDRRAVWNTSGLEGPALAIVEGDRGAGNWWRKVSLPLCAPCPAPLLSVSPGNPRVSCHNSSEGVQGPGAGPWSSISLVTKGSHEGRQ